LILFSALFARHPGLILPSTISIEFAIADERIELMCRDVAKEQHHQPELYRQKARPIGA
jgi:hypothetical protein